MLAHQSRTKQGQQPSGSPGGYIGAQTIARSSKLHRNLQLMTSNSRASNGSTFQSYYDYQQQHQFKQYRQQSAYTLSSQDRNSILMMQKHRQQQRQESLVSLIERQALLNRPLCRCRVMYLGSSVPHITKNGLHGIQEPLKQLYPEEQFTPVKMLAGANHSNQQQQLNGTIDISHLSSSLGIDSWLSVWSNGLLLENVDEFGRETKRFFSIESLHYCAAVRFFDTTTLSQPIVFDQHQTVPRNTIANGDLAGQQRPFATAANGQQHALLKELIAPTTTTTTFSDPNNNSIGGGKLETAAAATELLSLEPAEGLARQQRQRKSVVRFLPLDAPLFQCPGMVDANHPPVFAAILRRTTGIKVLECHAFICRRDAAANALVRCCTQAYADLLSAKRLSIELAQQEVVLGPNYSAQACQLPADYNNCHCAPATKSSGSRTLSRPSGRHHKRSLASNGGGSLCRLRSSSQPPQGDRLHSNGCAVIEAQLNIGAASARSSTISGSIYVGSNNHGGSKSRSNNINIHPSSTATTTTASTTNTSNEDNSLEASSEDNYAIISRHHYKPVQQTGNVAAAAGVVPTPPLPGAFGDSRPARLASLLSSGSGSSGSRRETSSSRKKAGSSKSLFKDFMPQVNEMSAGKQSSQRQHSRQVDCSTAVSCLNGRLSRDMSEKLSQSLDLLQLADIGGGANGNGSYCGLTDRAARDSVQYSVVRSKRHSRSMQNLNPPPQLFATRAGGECNGSQTGIGSCHGPSSRAATATKQHRNSKGSTRSRNGRHPSEKSRKASSYQDMLEPIRKGGSLSSELTVHSSSGSHHEQQKHQQQRKNNCENNSNGSNFYAATCDYGDCAGDCQVVASSSQRATVTATSSSRHRHQYGSSLIRASNDECEADALMAAAADQIVQLPMGDTGTMVSSSRPTRKTSAGSKSKLKHGSSTFSSSKGSRRRRGALSALQHQDPVSAGPPLQTKACYQQQQQQAYKVLYPQPSQAAPMFMPAGCFLPAPYQTVYAAGPIYEPAAYLQAGLAHFHPHHPHQLAPFAASVQHHQLQHHAHFAAGVPYTSHPLATATLGRHKISGLGSAATTAKNPKSSLARFRCLSPPVNFLIPRQQPQAAAGAAPAGSSKPGGDEAHKASSAAVGDSNQSLQGDISTATTATAAPADTKTPNGAQERPSSSSLGPNGKVAATSESTTSQEEHIVSGTPGFISSSQATLRRKKMGWIKRLSLTMTAGLSGDESDCGAGQACVSLGPSGGGSIQQPSKKDAGSKQRKKRSGLFSGSLTLGRDRQQHAKLVTS